MYSKATRGNFLRQRIRPMVNKIAKTKTRLEFHLFASLFASISTKFDLLNRSN